MSLQSGCNETLKRMNRKYTTKEFQKVVERLRNTFPDVMLTTDIIVGFPGETEEEFEITYNFLETIKFYKMHIFKYSQRKGTIADKMPNQINGEVKEKRSRRLLDLSDKNEIEYLKKYIGKSVKVLFEQKDGEYYKGHTTNYIMVKTKEKGLQNKFSDVKVTKQKCMELIGELQKNNETIL